MHFKLLRHNNSEHLLSSYSILNTMLESLNGWAQITLKALWGGDYCGWKQGLNGK